MKNTQKNLCLLVAPLALFAWSAEAREPLPSELVNRQGMSVFVGGGIEGFTHDQMRDYASGVGGAWEARVIYGTRSRIGIEGAYHGSGQSIEALGLSQDAVLVGTTLEANARVNFSTTPIQPFVIVGAGWRHFGLTNSEGNTSDVTDSDNVFEIPMGVGVAYRVFPVVFDVRGTFRPAFGNDLVAAGNAELHTWSATARAGFEF